MKVSRTSSVFIYSHNPRAREVIEGPEKQRIENPKVWGKMAASMAAANALAGPEVESTWAMAFYVYGDSPGSPMTDISLHHPINTE